MQPKLIFLGTGAGCGVPSFFCGCAACQEAIAKPPFRRMRCAAAIRGETTTLIDSPAELRTQLIREGIDHIDHFLMTHWHYDHSGGLGDLEFYVRVKRGEAIPAYMTRGDQGMAGHGFLVFAGLPVHPADCPGLPDGSGWRELHRPGGGPCAWNGRLADGNRDSGKRTAYITDSGPLPSSTCEKLQGIDTLILGATFWGRNWMPETHLSVAEAVQIALDLKVKRAYFTHLSMHHDTPVTNAELEAYLGMYGKHLHLAYDGLQIEL